MQVLCFLNQDVARRKLTLSDRINPRSVRQAREQPHFGSTV